MIHPDVARMLSQEAEDRAKASLASQWKCKARASALPDPQDCGWPTCGCDPYADKVISALEESGAVLEEANRCDILEEAACIADKIADTAYRGNLQEWAGREIVKRIRALKSSSPQKD